MNETIEIKVNPTQVRDLLIHPVLEILFINKKNKV